MGTENPEPKHQEKLTRADATKNFSHERPGPTTPPPIIQPIQLIPPAVPVEPNPPPQPESNNNQSSDN